MHMSHFVIRPLQFYQVAQWAGGKHVLLRRGRSQEQNRAADSFCVLKNYCSTQHWALAAH